MDYLTAVSYTCARAMEFLLDPVTEETSKTVMYECQWDSTFTGTNENVTLPNCTCE